jgi:thiamine pyrophosphokinase
MLANVYLLALPQLAGCDAALVARKEIIRVLRPGTYHFEGHQGDTISLIPLGGDVHGITTADLRYALQDESLYFAQARGVSNVMNSTHAEITIREGMLIFIHSRGH